MTSETRVRDSFAVQADWCQRLGSPFTSRLLEGVGRLLDRSTKTGQRVLSWQGPPDAMGDGLALRLAGALHALARRGDYPDLTNLYPPNRLPDAETLTKVAMNAIRDRDGEVEQWLDYPPQTNEVARSAILYPGLMQIAAETGLPLGLYEIGCSAGLNLIPDKYTFRLADVTAGRTGSTVVLAPDWQGASPNGAEPLIISRRGCDRNVLNVRDPAHCERIVSYVWPDQVDRIDRVSAALELARTDPPRLEQADAADWIESVIEDDESPGMVRVVFHSIAYQYFGEEAQCRIAARIEDVGNKATADRPLAWLSFEQFEDQGPRLLLRLWPTGECRVLGFGDAHCRFVRWT